MCPQCGKTEPVLQSVVSDQYECRAELGGCGSQFAHIPTTGVRNVPSVREAVTGMHDAICRFEQQEFPLGCPSSIEMRRQTDELLEILKQEIGRIVTVLDGQ